MIVDLLVRTIELADATFGALGLMALLGSPFWLRIVAERRAQNRLDLLSAGVAPDQFDRALGPPAFTRTDGDLTTRTYVDRRYLVEVIADEDSVRQYAVTTRTLGFRPRIPFPNGGWYSSGSPPLAGWLGRSRLSTVLDWQVQATMFRGARRFGYVEWAYLANPGNYQTVGLAINDAAPWDDGFDALIALFRSSSEHERTWSSQEALDDAALQHARRIARPNTYIITAASEELSTSRRWPGPDMDVVRVLQESRSWRARSRLQRRYGVSRRRMLRTWLNRR